MSKRYAVIIATAFLSMFSATACGGVDKDEVQQKAQEQVQEATQQIRQEAQEANQRIEQETQEIQQEVKEKAEEGQ